MQTDDKTTNKTAETAGSDPQRIDPRTGRPPEAVPQRPGEVGGPQGPEPTRFGDWEVKGRCSDF